MSENAFSPRAASGADPGAAMGARGLDGPAARAAAGRPITILQVTPELNAGGVERGTLEIAQAVAAAGGRALVASAGGRMASRLRAVGAELIEAPLASKNPLTIRANATLLARIIRAEGVDVVHARSRAPGWSALWAVEATRRDVGARFVTTYHGAYSEGLPLKRAYNGVMARGERVIAISDFVARLIRSRHGTPAERITVIPRGADISQFAEEAVEARRVMALAEAWGVSEDLRPVVMMPGRLTRWKGQTLFLEAARLVKEKRGPDFAALIVGGEGAAAPPRRAGARAAPPPPPGRFEREIQSQIDRMQLGDVARLVGHCDDMPAAFRLASYAVSASLEPEAFGRVAVEAQAMGAPIIAAAHGGAMETVIDGVTGWLFEPGDAETLAAAIDHALSQPREARRRMGAAAIQHVRGRFTVETMQLATLALYEELLERRF